MRHLVPWSLVRFRGGHPDRQSCCHVVGGLVGSVKARVRGTDKEKPPRRNPGGQKEPNRWTSVFDRITALPVLGLGGRDFQAHLLAQDAGHKATDRMRLPAGGFHEFLPGGAA